MTVTEDRMSSKQLEVLRLIECGMDTDEIAEEMALSRYTVRDKIRRMRMRFGVEKMRDLPDALRAQGIDVPRC